MEGLVLGEEVRAALDEGRAVVALESTIISHGFPYPSNLECALETERVIREEGAVPATVAIIAGNPTVGLSSDQIEYLATASDIHKASRRDMAVLVARGMDGATTVAGTMILAAAAGLHLFATGGIGGVHRGAERTFDISADLLELARTDIAVVCAGAKSILDIGLTLEVLETHGVPVLGYRTDEFPAFYTRSSGHGVEWRCDSVEEIAEVIAARKKLGLGEGVVVANPIAPEHEIDPATLSEWTEQALADAKTAGVSGKDVTPFLLARIHEISGGASEEANKQLVYSNARLAARVTLAL